MTSVPCNIPRSLCLKYKSKFYPHFVSSKSLYSRKTAIKSHNVIE